MPRPDAPSGLEAVPIFALYGEIEHWPTPDLLHCESIAERSRLHDWRIQPHRHADLMHLLVLRSGDISLELEGQRQRFKAPLAIVVPPMTIHGFHFSENIDGHILTLAAPLVERLEAALPEQARVWRRPSAQPLPQGEAHGHLTTLIEHIDSEYRRPAQGRDSLLGALVQALTIEASRLAVGDGSRATKRGDSDRSHRHLTRYQTLIETQFRRQPGIADLAQELDLSAAHLNTLCRRLTGRSALMMLHERLLLEAKRELTYTNLTIAQVADGLGFSEPAYFTRFFKRMTGLAPRAFRQRQRRQD